MQIGGGDTLMDFDARPIRITMNERLIPRPSLGSSVQPRFVWDFIARRVPSGQTPLAVQSGARNPEPFYDDAVQLAIFIRRIDVGIRVPGGQTLADVLQGVGGDPRVAVAEDANKRPTFDGRGAYSPIRSMRVSVPTDANGNLELGFIESPNVVNMAYIEQIGQKFVDALGIVHEVVGIDRAVAANQPTRIKIDPPLAPRLFVETPITDLFFTAQVPASVSVITIRR